MATVPARRWTSFRTAGPNAPVLVFIHGGYWRALDKSDHSFVAPSFNAAGRAGGGAQLRAGPAVTHRAHHAADGRGAGLGLAPCGRTRRRPVAHRRGRPLGRRAPGGDAAVAAAGSRWPTTCRRSWCRARCRSRACTTWSPAPDTPFLQADLQLTPASVRRLSPAFFPRPKGKLVRGGWRRERRVHAPEPADPRRLGPHCGAGVRDRAGRQPLQRAQNLADPGRACMQLGLQLLGLR
jgi:arylformamidase